MKDRKLGDFSKNPKTPFVVQVPNKIRKRIAMHETKKESFLRRLASTTRLRKILSLSSKPIAKKRGSLWSRFTSKIANILQIKPNGVRK